MWLALRTVGWAILAPAIHSSRTVFVCKASVANNRQKISLGVGTRNRLLWGSPLHQPVVNQKSPPDSGNCWVIQRRASASDSVAQICVKNKAPYQRKPDFITGHNCKECAGLSAPSRNCSVVTRWSKVHCHCRWTKVTAKPWDLVWDT